MGKVLVVDDQRNMRTTLAMMLRGTGNEVDEAADGAQGRELGATGAYDVVLTDLRMGGADGIDVLRAIKQAQPMTEVIVMTAYGTIESAVEAMRLGAFDYIQKPSFEELCELAPLSARWPARRKEPAPGKQCRQKQTQKSHRLTSVCCNPNTLSRRPTPCP